jgi:preprotein translocase subunit SecG
VLAISLVGSQSAGRELIAIAIIFVLLILVVGFLSRRRGRKPDAWRRPDPALP